MAGVCEDCGHENEAGARFCSQCGTQLRSAQAFPAVSERRFITVVFSDVSGYTAMSEQLDPEDVQRFMNRVFEQARKIITKYGGHIEKLLGDAVMAVFGDPIAHEDDAERAVRSALELHAAVAELGPEIEERIGRALAMHTGVNTGPVVTGSAEFDDVVGDAINVAARLEDLSEAGEILLGPETAHQVRGVFRLEDRGRHQLKGKSGTVPVMRVLGLAGARSTPSRREAAFVGRHEELRILLDAVDQMRNRHSSVISIRAEAGAGKTRLLHEFRRLLPDDVQWLEGRAYAYGENIPYAGVADLLRRASGIDEDDDPASMEAKLRAVVADLTKDVDVAHAALARMLGLAGPEAVTLDPETYQLRVLEAVTGVTESLARRAPTVLTFQDLHWADPSTVGLIRDLIGRLSTPIVVVVNYRPSFDLGVAGAREIELQELSPPQTLEMLQSLLEGGEPPGGLAEFIFGRTDGNPFFIEEIVNSLVETETLCDEGGTWKIAGSLDEIHLPASIRGVIAARIDRLDQRRRRVLREASVVGRDFLYDVVAQVTTLPDDLDPSLDELEAADLIREKTPDPDLEYFFKHALTQDVAYEGLLKSEREQMHARAAAAIEAQFINRLEEVTETLAHHWSHSDNAAKAVHYLTAAASKGMQRFGLQESQAHFERAYEILVQEPDGDDRDHRLVELLLKWGPLAYYQARFDDYRRLLIAHQDAVDRVGNAEQRGMWIGWHGLAVCSADAEFREGLQLLDRALEIARSDGGARLLAHVQAWRTYALWWLGRSEDSLEAAREAMALATELPDDPYAWFKAASGAGLVLSARGEFAEAQSLAAELITVGERTGGARAKASAAFVMANVACLTGDKAASDAAMELPIKYGEDPIYDHAPAVLRLASLILAGEVEEARRYHDDQYQRYVVDAHVRFEARLLQLANGLLLTAEGRPADGFALIEQVEEASVAAGELIHVFYARVFLAVMCAEVAMADVGFGDLFRNLRFALGRGLHAKKEAHARLEDALAHLDEWGFGGARHLLEVTYARLLIHQGDFAGAEVHLENAIAAVAPAGDTAGLRSAQEMLAEVRGRRLEQKGAAGGAPLER